jgi:uncharacterized protein (TIGR00369 family)
MHSDIGPFGSYLGFELLAWEVGVAQLSLVVQPFMLNRSGVLHGGVTVALLDAAGGYAGTYCTVPGNVRRGATLSLSTSFVGQVRQGRIVADARVIGGGRSTFFARVEVRDGAGMLVAAGDCTYRLRSNSIDPRGFDPTNKTSKELQ